MDKTQNFISRAQNVHIDKYDYAHVTYKNTHTKVDIICPTHGLFSQRPNDHLQGRGCPACSGKRYMTLEVMVQRAKAIHGDVYDYSRIKDYSGYEVLHEIVCPTHGTFLQTPKAHLQQKHGCPDCGKEKARQLKTMSRLTTNQFIKQAVQTHGDTYDYSKVEYVTSGTKVEIVCKKHGSFFQTPNNHVSSAQGCPDCYQETKHTLVGGYCAEFFQKYPDRVSQPALLYVVHMTHETDDFIKVGITTKTVDERFNRGGTKHVSITQLATYYMPLQDAFNLEQRILRELAHHKYYPNHVMDGRTECLKNTEDVLQSVNQIISDYKASCTVQS